MMIFNAMLETKSYAAAIRRRQASGEPEVVEGSGAASADMGTNQGALPHETGRTPQRPSQPETQPPPEAEAPPALPPGTLFDVSVISSGLAVPKTDNGQQAGSPYPRALAPLHLTTPSAIALLDAILTTENRRR